MGPDPFPMESVVAFGDERSVSLAVEPDERDVPFRVAGDLEHRRHIGHANVLEFLDSGLGRDHVIDAVGLVMQARLGGGPLREPENVNDLRLDRMQTAARREKEKIRVFSEASDRSRTRPTPSSMARDRSQSHAAQLVLHVRQARHVSWGGILDGRVRCGAEQGRIPSPTDTPLSGPYFWRC